MKRWPPPDLLCTSCGQRYDEHLLHGRGCKQFQTTPAAVNRWLRAWVRRRFRV